MMYFIYIVSFSFGCGKKKRIMNTKKTKKGFLIRSLVFLSMTIKKAKRAEIYVQSVWIFFLLVIEHECVLFYVCTLLQQAK